MASRTPVDIVFPVGRIVWGSVHTAREKKDNNGNAKLKQDGSKDMRYEFGVAIPKTPGVDWKQEAAWGALIAAEANAAFPNGQTQRADFAFKVIDGDSTIPNKEGNKPCDRAGYPGNWIVSFSSTGAPQLFNAVGVAQPQITTQTDIMLPGDFVMVLGSVVGNDSTQTPGVYMNHRAVCFKGYHPAGRISSQAPVNASVFGAGAAAGAVLAPVGGAQPPAAPAPVAASSAPVAPAPTPVAPRPDLIQPPPAPVAPAAPRQVSKDGNTWPITAFTDQGWTEAQLLANGYTITG